MEIKRKDRPQFSMEFNRDEGWTIVASIKCFVKTHPDAVGIKEWAEWADELDKLLRQGL